MNGFIAVGYFLANLFFSTLLIALWLRVVLRYFHISTLHPISQMIYQFTNPLTQPFEKLLSSKISIPKRYDWAGLIVIALTSLFKFIAFSFLLYGTLLPVIYLLLFTMADLIIQPCNLFFYLILIRAVMSWVNPTWQHPAANVLQLLTEPLLQLGRKIIPEMAGFDFSPIVIMVILKIISLFMKASLPFHIL